MLCTVRVAGMTPADVRVALVVGNSAYRHTDPLSNPSNDAADMAVPLWRLGFEVIEGRDLRTTACGPSVRCAGNPQYFDHGVVSGGPRSKQRRVSIFALRVDVRTSS